MSKIKFIALIGLLVLTASFTSTLSTKQVKCMVQLINYEGEGAYVIVSVVDKDDKYLTTLKVLGDDPEWYHEIDSWWAYYGKKRYSLDAVTGATISGGERSIFQLAIDEEYFAEGNKLRFETAVEEQKYFEADLEIPLGGSELNAKAEGTGYIRYVRLIESTQ
ncbi:MAG: DUF2271 domain-containing protein [Bacteroidota bacterium]